MCVFFLFSFYCKNPYVQEKGRDLYTVLILAPSRKDLKNTNPTNGSSEFFRGRGHEAFISGLSDMRRGLAMCSASPPMKVPTGSSRSKRGTAREGRDGRARVGSLNGRNPSPPKPLKTRQQKGRSSETPLKEEKERTGFQVNSCCCFFIGPV